jgi:hypothetical protein
LIGDIRTAFEGDAVSLAHAGQGAGRDTYLVLKSSTDEATISWADMKRADLWKKVVPVVRDRVMRCHVPGLWRVARDGIQLKRL